ncbi:MAG TPA: hypothetical protein VND15_02670 [Candidatus Acidoferrales bacterium]|nr:hypothetical protein [Candidatus Acidoferrales bacterium]
MNAKIFVGFVLLTAVMAPLLTFAATSGPTPIPNPPNFQLSTNVLTLCKGMVNQLPITVTSPPGSVRMDGVQLAIISKYVYAFGNGTVSGITNVSANSSSMVQLPIFVSLNASSLISAGVGINYEYDSLYSDSETRNISFGTQSCPSALQVSIIPSTLTSGRIDNVTLVLSNKGNNTLNYVSIRSTLPSQDGTFLGIQPVGVGVIGPMTSVNLTQRVFVFKNATQSFPVNMTINLFKGTSPEQISYTPIVLSAGIINITPSSTTLSPTVPAPGSIFSISFILTDVGTAGATAVTATPMPPAGFSTYGSNTVFVGDMATDSQTPVTLTLTTASATEAGSYVVPVRINYLNSLRQNLSTVVNVPVTLGSGFGTANSIGTYPKRTTGGSGGLLPAILVIIIIVLGYLLYKEKRKAHPRPHAK